MFDLDGNELYDISTGQTISDIEEITGEEILKVLEENDVQKTNTKAALR